MSYSAKEKPPVCLHVLGQGLVNACHKEARELRLERDNLIEAAQALIDGADDQDYCYAVSEELILDLRDVLQSMKEE